MSGNSNFPVTDDNVLSLERVEYVCTYSSGSSTGNGEIYFNRQPTQAERKVLEESWSLLGTSSLDLTFSHHVLNLTQTTLWQLYSFVCEIWAVDVPHDIGRRQTSRDHSDSLGNAFARRTGQDIELDWIQQDLLPPEQIEVASWLLREEQLAGVIRRNHASLHRLPLGTMESYRRHKYISWLLSRELKE